MPKIIDLTGRNFDRLTVIKYAYSKDKERFWECLCECGNTTYVRTKHLNKNKIKSCGCLRKERLLEANTKYEDLNRRMYSVWANMKQRCFDKNVDDYHYYGGRGITVCHEWLEFQNFHDWAIANGYEDTLTIDRIDTNGNYEPSNCRWIPQSEQSRNRRNVTFVEINGETRTLADWSKVTGINLSTLFHRYKKGKTGEELIKPVSKSRGNR